MLTFKHTGKRGDVIFSLPTIKAMGGGILYLPRKAPEVEDLYGDMWTLLKAQPYIEDVLEYPDCDQYGTMPLQVDVDLDRHRTHRQRGKVNMVQRYFDVFGIKHQVPRKWLYMPDDYRTGSILFSLTPRFRERSRVDWKKVYRGVQGLKFFVGTEDEHAYFERSIAPIQRLVCHDVAGLAININMSAALYCNQSLPLALAIALGKPYYCDFKYGRTNCRFYTNNENSLR